ncbi:hypothetical protein IHI24_000920 [Rickettsia endosymbiont of Cardiosporidium cionae]|nr:hypothetical protein IHI24_000920 [Rickettsia endosymbiont of Cardiosporidium cionae]
MNIVFAVLSNIFVTSLITDSIGPLVSRDAPFFTIIL